MTAAVWFEAHADHACDCGCDIDPGDLAAWVPDGDGGDGAVVCLNCGEAAEQGEAAA